MYIAFDELKKYKLLKINPLDPKVGKSFKGQIKRSHSQIPFQVSKQISFAIITSQPKARIPLLA